jgi:hypothetical protein
MSGTATFSLKLTSAPFSLAAFRAARPIAL